MKRIIAGILVGLACLKAGAQTFPVNNLTVAGTASFTLSPTGPTPSPGDSSTKLATTSFVASGFATLGSLTGLAPLASPTFTGTPSGPTAAKSVNNTQLATTAFAATSLPCANIMAYGGNSTNSASNNAAFIAAVSASQNFSNRVCVEFPPGVFQFASSLSYTLPGTGASITLKGSGQDVTELTFPNATHGIVVNMSSPGHSAHIHDMTISTGVGNGGTGIILAQTSPLNQFAQNDIENVTLRGADNNSGTGGADYWTNGIWLECASGVTIDTVTTYGNGTGGGGVIAQGSASNCYSIYINISKSVFNSLAVGVTYGNYAQGITITQSNFQNTGIGVNVPAGGTGMLSQLQVSDSQFATTGTGIQVLTPVGQVLIHDNDMFCHVGQSCINLSTPDGFTIHGNGISTDGSGAATGISIGTPVAGTGGVITGNNINGLNVGIQLTSGALNTWVMSNNYNGVTTNANNLSTSATIHCGSACTTNAGTVGATN